MIVHLVRKLNSHVSTLWLFWLRREQQDPRSLTRALSSLVRFSPGRMSSCPSTTLYLLDFIDSSAVSSASGTASGNEVTTMTGTCSRHAAF